MTEDFSPAPLPQVVTPTPLVPVQASLPAVPAGWHPHPDNPALQRYWDGNGWTEHTAPAVQAHAAPVAPPMPQQQIVIQNSAGGGGGVGTSHGLHLFLTIITIGAWAPVWLIMTLINRSKRNKGGGNYIQR